MIDFQNSVFTRLSVVNNQTFASVLFPLLVPEEQIIASFQGVRDGVVFTNYRIVSINIQGISGKKKDLTSMPYSKIQVFSVETAGTLDADSELEIWFSGVGKVKFEFTRNTNIAAIGRIISERVL